MTKAGDDRAFERYRRRVLATQLELARRKYRALVNEARRSGRLELLEPGERD